VIYVDSSVALAQLLSEDRRPPEALWGETLVSSRLIEFELLNVLRARGLESTHEPLARDLLARVGLLELIPEIVGRREGAPRSTRTLDALHLASALFLLENGAAVELATYDARMRQGARKLRIPLFTL
jgi:predicted nucleic acid-binding protein